MNFLNASFPSSSPMLLDALGRALVHSLWQGAAVLVVARVALALLHGRSANVRYLVAIIALGLMLVAPAATFVVDASSADRTATSVPVAAVPVLTAIDATMPVYRGVASDDISDAAALDIVATPVEPQPVESLTARATAALTASLPWLAALWCAGVIAVGLWHLGGWVAAQRMRSVGVSPADDSLGATVQRLAGQLEVGRPVRLLRSTLVRTPVVLGWLRPVIVLPVAVASGLTPAQLEAILAHELAHVRRHDYLVNLFQCLVETLMFYHPAVWWASAVVREERENCCDDAVLAAGVAPLAYAESLVRVLEAGGGAGGGTPAVALAASGRPSQLRRRLMRMLPGGETRQPRATPGRWVGAVAAAACVIAFAGILRLSTAADTATAADDSKPAQAQSDPAPAESEKPAADTDADAAPADAADEAAALAARRAAGSAAYEAARREWLRRGFHGSSRGRGGLPIYLAQRPQIYLIDLDGGPLGVDFPGRELEINRPDTKFDVGFETRLDAKGFLRRDLVVVPMQPGDWDTTDAATVHARLTGHEPGTGVYAVDWVHLPKVFAYRTRDGGEGMLRVDWFFKQEDGAPTTVGWTVQQVSVAKDAVVAPAAELPRVMLVTEGNFFLERWVSGDPAVKVTTVKSAALARDGGADPDEFGVVIFDRHRPAKPPARSHVLSFGVVPPGSGLRAPAELRKGVSATHWKRDHPVMRGLDMSKLDVAEALKLEAPEDEGWDVLVDAADGPLIVAREAGGRREVVVAFDVNESTWPLSRTFPLFLHQCLAWLAGGDEPAGADAGPVRPPPPPVKGPADGADAGAAARVAPARDVERMKLRHADAEAKLQQLARMRRKGAATDSEYETAKIARDIAAAELNNDPAPVARLKVRQAEIELGRQERMLKNRATSTSAYEAAAIARDIAVAELNNDPAQIPRLKLRRAELELKRQETLHKDGAGSVSEYERAKADRDIAAAELNNDSAAVARVKLRLADLQLERQEALRKDGVGSVSEYETAKTNRDMAAAGLNNDRAEVARLKVRLAKINLERVAKLLKRNAVAKSEFEAAEAAYDEAKAAYDEAKAR